MHEKYERSIMKTVFLSYNFEDEIPVAQYLKNKNKQSINADIFA